MKCQNSDCPNEGKDYSMHGNGFRAENPYYLCAYHAIDYGEKVEDEEYLLAEIGFRNALADKLFREVKREELRVKTLENELEILRRRKDVSERQNKKDH